MVVQNDIDRREVIKQCARELFFRFGFTKTSMEDIAQQSGLAKATLYYYYENKEAIFDEIVLEEASMFMDEVQRGIPTDKPADEQVALFFRNIYDGLAVYAERLSELPEYFCEHSPHGRPIIEKLNQIFTEKLKPLLLTGRQQGLFDFDDIDLTAQAIMMMTHFINMEWIIRCPESQRRPVLETTIALIINGLKRRS